MVVLHLLGIWGGLQAIWDLVFEIFKECGNGFQAYTNTRLGIQTRSRGGNQQNMPIKKGAAE